MTLAFSAPYKCSYLLTYLLTYKWLHCLEPAASLTTLAANTSHSARCSHLIYGQRIRVKFPGATYQDEPPGSWVLRQWSCQVEQSATGSSDTRHFVRDFS